jgi:hypothetical protein
MRLTVLSEGETAQRTLLRCMIRRVLNLFFHKELARFRFAADIKAIISILLIDI